MKHYCSFWTDGGKRECCKLHDEAYSKSGISRFDADVALLRCVYYSGRPVQAIIMFLAVRCFGRLFYQTEEQ